jgi:hypothetical protein
MLSAQKKGKMHIYVNKECRMEKRMDDFYRTQRLQMPYYMKNPMQNYYWEEIMYDRDMDRMKEMYPKEVRNIQRLVEDECDRMEYDGSLMFDLVPDRILFEQICRRIEDRLAQGNPNSEFAAQGCGEDRCSEPDRNMIRVLMCQEMYHRRCRYNRCKRWW